MADLNFIDHGDNLRAAGHKIPAGQAAYFTVIAHGTSGDIRTYKNLPISAQELAAIIKEEPSARGKTIVLFACRTGGATADGSPNFAQQLSNLLGQKVIAPQQPVWWDSGGTYLGAYPQMWFLNWPNRSGPSEFKLFWPGDKK